MNITITGSRSITDHEIIAEVLAPFVVSGPHKLIHGAARGVDRLAAAWAKSAGWVVEAHPADWSIGKHAGFVRNAEMVSLADLVVAIWDGKSRGTKHTIDTALKKGVDLWVHQIRTQTPQRSHTTQPTHPSEPQAIASVESHPHLSPAAQPNNGSDDQ